MCVFFCVYKRNETIKHFQHLREIREREDMRGGALRLYEPGQRGRGLGGVIKKAASYLGQRFVLLYLKKKATKKLEKH